MKRNLKLNNTYRSGVTLLELTVVILVLLSLIAILFIGASSWKKGSDRAANVLNLRNSQLVVRSHQNLYDLQANASFTLANFVTYREFPANIGAIVTYNAGTQITPVGTLWITPSANAAPVNVGQTQTVYGPTPGLTLQW
jgi:type II secretory pathway pseudopilin PulG